MSRFPDMRSAKVCFAHYTRVMQYLCMGDENEVKLEGSVQVGCYSNMRGVSMWP